MLDVEKRDAEMMLVMQMFLAFGLGSGLQGEGTGQPLVPCFSSTPAPVSSSMIDGGYQMATGTMFSLDIISLARGRASAWHAEPSASPSCFSPPSPQ